MGQALSKQPGAKRPIQEDTGVLSCELHPSKQPFWAEVQRAYYWVGWEQIVPFFW